jgi:large subunit ribosomal protein L18e
MKHTGPTNIHLRKLISKIKKQKTAFWKQIAIELSKPTRIRRSVNLSKINRHTKDGETVIVPGKVLSAGKLDHKVTISAWQFSDTAKARIVESGSKPLTINQLLEENPKGSGVKILG